MGQLQKCSTQIKLLIIQVGKQMKNAPGHHGNFNNRVPPVMSFSNKNNKFSVSRVEEGEKVEATDGGLKQLQTDWAVY